MKKPKRPTKNEIRLLEWRNFLILVLLLLLMALLSACNFDIIQEKLASKFSKFFRKGTDLQWKNILTKNQLIDINKKLKKELKENNY